MQLLLQFAQQLEHKPIHPEDLPAYAEPGYKLRRVKRRRGRRHLANFENLPVTTHVYELKPEERACPGCGVWKLRQAARLASLERAIPSPP